MSFGPNTNLRISRVLFAGSTSNTKNDGLPHGKWLCGGKSRPKAYSTVYAESVAGPRYATLRGERAPRAFRRLAVVGRLLQNRPQHPFKLRRLPRESQVRRMRAVDRPFAVMTQ